MHQSQYTFLLPAYKAKFLAEALESIKNQTYKDFTCIVSDDYSPEDLKSIFNEVVGEDSRFTYRRNIENMGSKSLVSHWNFLVDMCKTEFLIMASDDDVYEPYFLEEIGILAEKYPQVNLFRGRVRKINQVKIVLEEDYIAKEFETQVEFLYQTAKQKRIPCVGNMALRTSTLKSEGNFKELPLAWGTDDIMQMYMSKNGVCNTQSLVFSFRCSGINITSQVDSRLIRLKNKARIDAALIVEKFLSDLSFEKTPLNEYYFKEYKRMQLEYCYGDIKSSSYSFNFLEFLKIYSFLSMQRSFDGKIYKFMFVWTWFRNRLIPKWNFVKRQYSKFVAIPLAQRKLRHIRVLDSETSIRYIIEKKCSVSRFGDGELDILMGKDGNTFHTANPHLAKRLKDVLVSTDVPNLSIGIPYPLKDVSGQRKLSRDFWGFYTLQNVDVLKPYFSKERTYLDTQISRFYMCYQNKENKLNNKARDKSAQQLSLLKKIWDNQDIVIVEGFQSRTGVGNDLYDNARSIQRIIGLSTNAYEKYDEMLNAIVTYTSKDKLILLSYGMCATVLAYDLAKLGYWAIDIGHLDIEYEWFTHGETNYTTIAGKFTNESGIAGRENISECNDEIYLSQIIFDITK